MRPQNRSLKQPLAGWSKACLALMAICTLAPPACPQEIGQAREVQTNAALTAARGHAHNDYVHDRPLLDALERNFASVEADIFLKEGQLLIGHTQLELSANRTLEGMYLQPLADWFRKHDSRTVRQAQPLILLIDIKTEAAATWEVLHPLLVKYRDLLSETSGGTFQPRAVTIVISGNRAGKEILAARPQLAGIDGRMSDLGGTSQSEDMPLVSDAWSKHFRWRGAGPMPADERHRLGELVSQAHKEGRLVRFWGTPELESLWSELRGAGVDLIGTDDLPRLEKFLAQPPDLAPALKDR